MTLSQSYIGRFAPSPSGPLHFGSLLAALGSYLQAKAQNGQWLVRIEDLDPPREMPGASADILRTLEAYGLHWDGEIIYQSQRHGAYQAQIETWLKEGIAYACQCSRKQIKEVGGYYPGTCRDRHLPQGDTAIRLHQQHVITSFEDQRYGTMTIPEKLAQEDFIIRRRDGLYAYNLAVVLDDIAQGVTEVVRGADLIEPTGRQISLYRLLGVPEVKYLHLPLAVTQEGYKLSKQNQAPAIDRQQPIPALRAAMGYLGLPVHEAPETTSPETLLAWGVERWHSDVLPNRLEITYPE
ncbi:tRNA glutamyl-Q(34) synthetase GluQRS [Thaumasiovibrio subtropicus]|uniref:tRNA glutamyl-Q(34) synthetase GluQRS n=1 Tax=Thaumasiovibrio subtropicus TaxID=1891207 RepID=UPI000B362C7D|nr:tRNA glutamyl-Q(34) synthetase GluQRS [Thaumasiovibrio subtropicus]